MTLKEQIARFLHDDDVSGNWDDKADCILKLVREQLLADEQVTSVTDIELKERIEGMVFAKPPYEVRREILVSSIISAIKQTGWRKVIL